MNSKRSGPIERGKPMKTRQVKRDVLPGYCQCGCEEYVGFWETTDRSRERIKGEPRRFAHGHNARRPGVDYDTEHHCAECGALIHRNGTTGLCRTCQMASVGRANLLPHANCQHCGQPCPTTERRFCSWECYQKGRVVPTGSDHHSWLGDAVGTWGARSRTQKEVPSGPCESCGVLNADRHHKDRDIHNNSLDNIAYLCRSCHGRRHRKEDGLKGAAGVKGPRGPQKNPRRKKEGAK